MKVHTDSLIGKIRRIAGAATCALMVMLPLATVLAPAARAQEGHEHPAGQEHGHSHGLHFTHPLIAESVSPDTKVRMDYAHRTPTSEGEVEFEGEYAFHRSFSIEVGIPTLSRNFQAGSTEFGPEHIHAAFKFANYAFEDQGLLLGYGLEFGLPWGRNPEAEHGGHVHGQDVYEISPFLNAGLMAGDWELVGFGIFSIPTHQDHQENVSTTFRYNLSALYHATPRLEPLLELNGQTGLSGAAIGEAASYVTPGLRVLPFTDMPLAVGLGLSVPLTDDRGFDTRTVMSLFYHF